MSNSIIEQQYPEFEMIQWLRTQLLETLTDADLSFTPGGENPPLSQLFIELEETEEMYIRSFQTYRLSTPPKEDRLPQAVTVSELLAEFVDLDQRLEVALRAIPEADVDALVIERDAGLKLSPRVQLQTYEEALFIFYGKVMVYLKAMGKPRTPEWEKWVG